MNYRELKGLAHYHEWAAKLKAPIDGKNKKILEERQRYLDQRTGIGVGDFVLDGENTLRVAHDWGDVVQLTTGEFGASFYLGDCYVDFSGGLEPGIDKLRFQPTDERREGAVWFFSENWARAHNGFDTNATFRVWVLTPWACSHCHQPDPLGVCHNPQCDFRLGATARPDAVLG
jgi:hypothetical protein